MARSLGDPDAALTDLAAIIALEPTNADTYLVRANIQRASGKPEAVAAEAAALIKAAPDNSYAHVVAARIYQSLGRRDDALREFDRALAIKPAAYIYLNRIDSRPKTDRTGRMADMTLAAKLEPQSPDVLAKKADLLVEDDTFIEAITLYDAQLAKTPADVRLLLARGFAKFAQEIRKGAR
jgi:tetratricopeptide (TPR) repeat protein